MKREAQPPHDSNQQQQDNRSGGGCLATPCGAGKCDVRDIDPEHFLEECCAPMCWDCWFVPRKLHM